MELKHIYVHKLSQTEGSNHSCEVMRKNGTKCTTHAAFELKDDKYNFICAFHFNIFKSIAANSGKQYVLEAERPQHEQVSPETRVS
ncbi:MAG TPA: hypothetical protein VGF75_00455 [Candidatus Saccharimonadales bacterium]|jgi:hypothetical protein